MPYTTLLLDFDHTLLDSGAAEVAAFDSTLLGCGIENPPAYFDTYQRINGSLWAAVERGELMPGDVRAKRFELFADEAGLDADPGAMADSFVNGLAMNGDLYPGARAVLEQLAASASLAMVTNGLGEVQRGRIERLDIGRYFDTIVISAEVGASKPGKKIFDITIDRLDHPIKASVLMVGNSLSSDIKGGSDYGLATCWYNPDGKVAGPEDSVTHEIASLAELIGLSRNAQRATS